MGGRAISPAARDGVNREDMAREDMAGLDAAAASSNHARMMKFIRRLVLVSPIALVAACAGGSGPSDRPQVGVAPSADECKIARDEHPKIIAQFGGEHPDANIRRYVSNVGRQLAAQSEMPNIEWHYTVLNSDVVNAFALPCGYVYVTRGLLALASSEAELAGVLGHETGHVTAQHTAQRLERGRTAAIGAVILGGIVGLATGSGAVGDVVTQATFAGAQPVLAGYSRDQEFQADELGVAYLSRARYDTRAMARFLEKLDADSRLTAEQMGNPGAADQFSIMQSHPRTLERVRRSAEEAKEAAQIANPRVAADEHLRMIDGMTWGGDDSSGFVKNNVFVHPGLRFRFEVPRGFRLMNSDTAVAAIGPAGARVIFDRDEKAPRGDGSQLARHLASTGVQGVEELTIDRLPAATGTGRVRTNDGQALDVRRVLIRGDGAVWRFTFVTPPNLTAQYNDAFRRTTFSFDQLTPQEAASQRPFRVRLVRVGASDTQETLAQRMATDDGLRRFQVLNGLRTGDRVPVGQMVKVIADR